MTRSVGTLVCAISIGLAVSVTTLFSSSAYADRLASVKKAGVLHCGIVQDFQAMEPQTRLVK